MPRFDGTGPAGRGRMFGRGMGKCCAVKNSEEISSQDVQLVDQKTGTVQGLVRRIGQGLGLGQGRGYGAGQGGRKGR
jgi:hypothetical protein